MGFEQDPDYVYLRGLFKKIMEKNKLEHDFEFDWVKKLNLNRSKSNFYIFILIFKYNRIFPINLSKIFLINSINLQLLQKLT